MLLDAAPSTHLVIGTSVVDALVQSALSTSKSDARRLIEGKGVSINGSIIESVDAQLEEDHFDAGLALLKRGKQVAILLCT